MRVTVIPNSLIECTSLVSLEFSKKLQRLSHKLLKHSCNKKTPLVTFLSDAADSYEYFLQSTTSLAPVFQQAEKRWANSQMVKMFMDDKDIFQWTSSPKVKYFFFTNRVCKDLQLQCFQIHSELTCSFFKSTVAADGLHHHQR